MRSMILLCLVLISTSAVGDDVAWSPDGKWLAYATRARSGEPAIRPGWLFGPDRPDAIAVAESHPDPARRLWATRADLSASILLDEAGGYPLDPAWSPDGRAVAFGREGEDGKTLEVVVWEGPGRRRVVAQRPLPGSDAQVDRIAWSGDRRYLAIPQGGSAGLAIVRVTDGRQVNAVPGGRLPAWSPDGARLACFVTTEAGAFLVGLDSALGVPRTLIEVVKATQPPTWTRDGLVTVVYGLRPGRLAPDRLASDSIKPVELVRVRVESGQAETIYDLAHEPGLMPSPEVVGFRFAVDRDGEDLFWTMGIPGRDHHVVWYRPRDGLIRTRLPILDPTLPIATFSVSPRGDAMAVRFGPADRPSPPLLVGHDTRDQKLRPVAPDDDARADWLALLVDSVRSSLQTRSVTSPHFARPTLLPLPGEIEPTGELPNRILRVSALGRPLCDRPDGASAIAPEMVALLDEARLFFDVLREDAGSLASLEAFERRADTPEHRLALLGLRAQIALARDDFDQADRTIAYLHSIEPKPAPRLEWAGAAPILVADPTPPQSWVASLATRSSLLREVARAASKAATPTPFEAHFNPDAMPGQGLDPFGPGPAEARFGIPDAPVFIQPPPRLLAPPDGGADPAKRRPPRAFPRLAPRP